MITLKELHDNKELAIGMRFDFVGFMGNNLGYFCVITEIHEDGCCCILEKGNSGFLKYDGLHTIYSNLALSKEQYKKYQFDRELKAL